MTEVIVGLDQVQEQVQIDRIRCHKCREYDHFANNCPTSKKENKAEQTQQMYNMDEEQTALKH